MKKMMAMLMLAAVLMVGTTSANAGILLSDRSANQNQCGDTGVINDGILVAGFTGILVAGFTGILVAGLTANDQTSRDQTACRNGMLLSD